MTKFTTTLQAHTAALRFGRPSGKLKVVLVLGADGAAGTIAFLAAMLRADGAVVGVVTQHYVEIGGERAAGSDQADVHGDAFRLQALLAHMKRAACQYVLIEVPPELPAHQFIGLSPYLVIVRRCGDNYVDQSAMQARLAMLETMLARQPQAVVFNRDDPCVSAFNHLADQEGVMSFGTHAAADCRLQSVQLHPQGSSVRLTIDHQTDLTVTTALTGRQTIYNVTAAVAAAYVLQASLSAIVDGARQATVQPGLCEYLPLARPFQVVLDAASSPAGLAETLETLKHFAKNRLIVVFGAPLGVSLARAEQLAEIAATYADRLVLCDGEFTAAQPVADIRDHLLRGAALAGGDAKTELIADRTAAIEKALAIARRGDTVLIAATPQHPYRQLGSQRRLWNDREVVERVVG